MTLLEVESKPFDANILNKLQNLIIRSETNVQMYYILCKYYMKSDSQIVKQFLDSMKEGKLKNEVTEE